ncbi:hypothetical protein CIRMBP1310_01699 [Enterococcus cecorum]|uniref:hypothetical protein n=1 Tax=Enterococcus cecorum TaxID=44008 RepID=UPI000AD54DF6|nr:hypothetical protein [Enterococcus cecorum]MCJ0535932.1 hypothetical protein [Enterococcus cecorum]MCJ0554967.1 hypothetical protein [Enterococcus cecorum]CAI3479463.1 hypothetical protein CIRMBP1310_01699 [Enterococcus cecorum]CAI3502707.1 hypothetical protein CIRMBP1311_02102 [Enterococcus cecorum]
MKIIEVFIKLVNDEIKDQTILKIYDHTGDLYRYTFDGKFKAFYDESDDELGGDFEISNKFLNYEAELIEPIPKEYQLRLYEEDDLSYVVRSSYNSDFNYDLGSKMELCEFTTKFTQEEIDNDKLLKFVEQHGIKEEVEE